jgi:hypothetical protein
MISPQNRTTLLIVIIALVAVGATALIIYNNVNQQARTVSTQARINNPAEINMCNTALVTFQAQYIIKADGTREEIPFEVIDRPDAYGYVHVVRVKNTTQQPITIQYAKNTDFCRGPNNNGSLWNVFEGQTVNNLGCWMGQNGEPQDQIASDLSVVNLDLAEKNVEYYRDSDYAINCGSYQMDLSFAKVLVNGVENTACTTQCAGNKCLYTAVLATKNACPAEKPVCTGIEVSYTDTNGQKQTKVSTNFLDVNMVQTNTEACYNSLRLSNGRTIKGYHAAWDIGCLTETDPAKKCTLEQLWQQYRDRGGPQPNPRCVTTSSTIGTLGQVNGYIQPVDPKDGLGACAARFQTVGAPVPGQPTNTPVPGQPTSTPVPGQPTNTPAPPTVTLVPPTATPVPKACGASACNPADGTNACATGSVCIQANTGAYICSKPEYRQACSQAPSAGTCCNAPPLQPPSMVLNAPKNVCVERSATVSVQGHPGTYTGVSYQVWAKRKDGQGILAQVCPTDTISGGHCMIGSGQAASFTVNTGSLNAGDYQIYSQVMGSTNNILCTNNPDNAQGAPSCARICLATE